MKACAIDDRTPVEEDRIRRFSRARIVEHWSAVAVVAVLIATGLSQKYYTSDISQWLVLKAGGIDSLRLIHRAAGTLLGLMTFAHILVAAVGVLARGWPPSMLITRCDIEDTVTNMRYYLGLVPEPAACGRYTYRQKFEYWGMMSGALLMVASGVVLWFPTATANLLPGGIIPAAKVTHTNEAMVIFIIIAFWHVYNAIFNPDVSPLDTSIITGYISRERMMFEHPAELAEMDSVGKDCP